VYATDVGQAIDEFFREQEAGVKTKQVYCDECKAHTTHYIKVVAALWRY